jgi:hypothetical protein
MVISSVSAGPVTSGPHPAAKARSVAASRTPRMRQSPPMSGGDQGGPQRGQQPLWRDGARLSERAPDVLAMDERLGQGDPAA